MNDNKINIIKLKSNNWRNYKKIRLETLNLEAPAFNSKYEDCLKYPDNYWENKLRDKNEIHLFAKYDKKIIGTINATFNEENEKENVAVIHGTYVNSFHRRRGIGKQLIENLLKEINKNNKIKKIKLWVKETQIPARHIYELMGFLISGRAGEHTLIMEKNIN